MAAGNVLRPLLWGTVALGASVGTATLARIARSLDGPAIESFTVEASQLHFNRTVADFGTVFTSEVVEGVFGFRNTSDRPIRIVDIEYECGCLVVVPSTRWIPAGGRGSVRASFATHGRLGAQVVHVRVWTDEGPRTGALLKLRGAVHAVLRPSPPRVFLSDVLPGTRALAHVNVHVLEPIADLVLEAEGKGLTAELEPSGDGMFGLRVVVRTPAVVGTRMGGARLRYRHVDSDRRLETWVPVVWTVPPPLEYDPKTLELSGPGRTTLHVRPRWSNAHLAGVDTGTLPLRVTQRTLEGGATEVTIVKTGQSWEFPHDAVVRLVVAPRSIRPIEVPLRISHR